MHFSSHQDVQHPPSLWAAWRSPHWWHNVRDNSSLTKSARRSSTLCHISGLFLPHGADENENRVEGEREVG